MSYLKLKAHHKSMSVPFRGAIIKSQNTLKFKSILLCADSKLLSLSSGGAHELRTLLAALNVIQSLPARELVTISAVFVTGVAGGDGRVPASGVATSTRRPPETFRANNGGAPDASHGSHH